MFQADVDSMRQIAHVYADQLDRVWETIGELTRALKPLREGAWIGRGAEAFLEDMDSNVFTALKQISHYLEHSPQVAELTAALARPCAGDSEKR
jgi:uncharacterized protein YukE